MRWAGVGPFFGGVSGRLPERPVGNAGTARVGDRPRGQPYLALGERLGGDDRGHTVERDGRCTGRFQTVDDHDLSASARGRPAGDDGGRSGADAAGDLPDGVRAIGKPQRAVGTTSHPSSMTATDTGYLVRLPPWGPTNPRPSRSGRRSPGSADARPENGDRSLRCVAGVGLSDGHRGHSGSTVDPCPTG